jgi:hypothetical protein
MCAQRRAIRGHINPRNTDTCFTCLSFLRLLIHWPSYFFQKCRTFVVTSLEHWSENCISPCSVGNLSDSFVLRVVETRQYRRCSRAVSIKVVICVKCSCRNRWLHDRADGRFGSYFSRATSPFFAFRKPANSVEQISFWEVTGSPASQEIRYIFGTRTIITVLTRACHLSQSWARSVPSIYLRRI